MKPVAYAAALLGLVSVALGQAETPGPSPTESVGCEPHGDHWHCEGPRVTSDAIGAATTNTIALTTTSTATHHHDEDGHDHDHDDDDHHTDASGTGALAPSPTESYGCEPHGDHWHCEGPITASGATTATTAAGAEATTSTDQPSSTAAAARYEVAGLGFAGLAAVAAMVL